MVGWHEEEGAVLYVGTTVSSTHRVFQEEEEDGGVCTTTYEVFQEGVCLQGVSGSARTYADRPTPLHPTSQRFKTPCAHPAPSPTLSKAQLTL